MTRTHHNGLGRSLIAQILLVNAVLSIFASSIQLYVGYQRDHNQLLSLTRVIEESFRSGFEDALWEYNFSLAEALLEGVYTKGDVEYVRLSTGHGRMWELGGRSASGTELATLDFSHTDAAGNDVSVGQLSIGFTLENIRARVWSQLWTLLLSNFAKTICACTFMLFLFDQRISRHLKKIASHVSSTSWPDNRETISLERAPRATPDDLDHIVMSINAAKQASHDAFEAQEAEIIRRQAVERLLKQRSDALEEANREQAEFTYAISHDLKSPANTIAMLLDELNLNEKENLSADGREILQDAGHTVSRMTSLVEDVLGYARTVESGLDTEDVNLNDVAEEVVADLRGDISAAQAEITILDLPVVSGSKIQLRLLLQNLLGNAIKFRAEGCVPRITLGPIADDATGEVGVSVEDNGIGIAPEFHEKVFGLFQRLHSHCAYGGSGLGLTLCKRIASNHAGRIELSSIPGQGTRFDVWLPRRDHG